MRAGKVQAPGKAFEQRVTDAYQSLGFRVTPNIQLPGKQTDLIARQDVPGAPAIKLAIECKDHANPVGNEDVLEFVHRVVVQTASSTVTGGVLVSASGFTADGRAAAEDHPNVTLLSWAELSSQIFDVRHQIAEGVERYEQSAIFHNYLSLAIELLGWSTMSTETSRAASGEALLGEWYEFDGESGLGIILALADFGSGKTTLLRNIEYDRAMAYLAGEDHRIPLFVPLREYRKSQDIGTLLRASFRDAYYRDIPTDLLWQRIESGNLFILLDGFDEMLDRSDANRRLALFHELMPVLRSRSPAILTSRPSYLVERGELDEMLSSLREQEAAITTPPRAGGAYTVAGANRLRQRLVARHREVRPVPGADEALDLRDLQVVRLLPLDDAQVEEFVARHSDELAEAGASVPDLLAFIKRTYDLSDLSTRPMLLNLIISSVVIGGLDISDTSSQYGASGLYEIYTHAKLDLDLAKGHSRQNGLSLVTRRMLAEAVAMEMYQSNVLELDFHSTLEKLRVAAGPLKEALDATGLTEEEIRTDFATCSFVTLDQDGKCRFVHKSFRGFFVARVLKGQLPAMSPLLSEHLEREVLYFLGNFSPTEPGVGEKLWARFGRADQSEATLKRNLLVAFLNTKPVHDSRRVSGAAVADAEFGRLVFDGTRLKDVVWKDAVVRDLEVKDAKWQVDVIDTNFIDFLANGGDLQIELERAGIETWRCWGANLQLTCDQASLNSWVLEGTTVRLSAKGLGQVNELKAKRSDLAFEVGEGAMLALADTELVESRLRIRGNSAPGLLEAHRSLVVYGGPQELIGRWNMDDCLLILDEAPEFDSYTSHRSGQAAVVSHPGTVILAPGGIAHDLLEARWGVFGSIKPASTRTPIQVSPKSWGVLTADGVLDAVGVPANQLGVRFGELLLVRDAKALELDLPALDELDRLSGSSFEGVSSLERIDAKRRELKLQHAQLLERKWADFRTYAARGR